MLILFLEFAVRLESPGPNSELYSVLIHSTTPSFWIRFSYNHFEQTQRKAQSVLLMKIVFPRRCLAMDSLLLSLAEAGRRLPGHSLAMDVCYCCHTFKREGVSKLLPSNEYPRYNMFVSCQKVAGDSITNILRWFIERLKRSWWVLTPMRDHPSYCLSENLYYNPKPRLGRVAKWNFDEEVYRRMTLLNDHSNL
jgi:hypothetical protein